MLGGFEVTVDEAVVPVDAWSRRQRAALVKVLALARGRRLHRDQVIDLCGRTCRPRPRCRGCTRPPTTPGARCGTDAAASLVLRNDLVALLP